MKLLGKWPIPPRRVVLWYAVSALPLTIVVSLGGYLSYHYHALSAQSQEQVDRAYEVLQGVAAVLVSVQDTDVAQLDFLITGSAQRLDAFDAARQAAVRRLAVLQARLVDDPPQLLRLSGLQAAIAAKTAELARTVAVRQTAGFEAARAIVAARDSQLSDRVRSQAAALAAAERERLRQRQEATREHERKLLWVGVLIATLSVATRILIALWLAHRRRKGTGAPLG